MTRDVFELNTCIGRVCLAQFKVFVRGLRLLSPILLCILVLGPATILEAQQNSYLNSIGTPTFSVHIPVENGNINLANGNLHLEISVGDTFPQRGGHSFRAVLMYDSALWYRHSGVPSSFWASYTGGWRLVTSADTGSRAYTTSQLTCVSSVTGNTELQEIDFNNFSWTAPDGTQHLFPVLLSAGYNTAPGDDCVSGITRTSANAFATDNSGYHLYATTNGGSQVASVLVYAPDGTQVYGGNSGPIDPNGNYYSSVSNPINRLRLNDPVDMLGRSPISISESGSSDYIDLLTSQGSRQRYTLVWATINVSTNFADSSATEYSGTISVIQEIDFPDGTKYQFTYDQGTTPGHFGLLTGMTLPTGGQVSYGYTTFSDIYGSKYRWTTSKTTSGSGVTGGTWSYVPQVISTCPGYAVNCQQKVTLTTPSADATVYTFNFNGGPWASQIQRYTGSASAGTLLSTTAQSFDYGNSCPANVQCNMPGAAYVAKLTETTTLPIPSGSVNQAKQLVWDSSHNGNLTQASEWTFYGATKPPIPDRTTCYVYLTGAGYSNINMVNRQVSTTIVDNWSSTPCTSPPTAHIVSQTLFSYDSSPVLSVTGIAQHDDTHFGTGYSNRGNVTQIQKLVTGSTSLTSSSTYDMTGQVVTSKDFNNNQTSYVYTDNVYDDPGDGSLPTAHAVSQPTNAYAKTVTLPTIGSVTLTSTAGYYWGSGKTALTTDANGNNSYFHFNDPLDRSTATLLPNTEWTRTTYSSTETQADLYGGTTSASASTTCTICRHDQVVLDALGRPISSILASDPSGATTTSTAYDSSGRVLTSSTPYRSTSESTYGLETPAYDGMGRTTQVKHADGDLAYTYYGGAVSSGGGAASQLCSSATYGLGYPALAKDEVGNKRQTWTDGFGRTIEADEPNASGSMSVNTCYKYDLNNNVIQVAAQSSQARSYSYDLLSRVTAVVTPESGTTSFYYTTGGGALCSGDPSSVCRRTDARSITTAYAYDPLNRLVSLSYSDTTPAVKYGYDAVAPGGCTPPSLTITNGKGRRTAMCDGSGQTAWSYDAVGNVLTQTRVLNGVTKSISYTYNLDGGLATITYPGGRIVTYSESNAQRMTSAKDISNSINYVTSAVYAPHGALSSFQNGAALVSTLYYSNRLQLCRISAKSSGTAPTSCADTVNKGNVLDLSYGYAQSSHDNGDITSQTNNVDAGRSQAYTYDPLNRLLTAKSQATSGSDCWGQSFGSNAIPPTLAADALGNMSYTTVTQCSSPQPRFTPNNSNHFTDSGISYDFAGNMTSDAVYSYTYDAENRIVTASGMTGGPYCYAYDGDGLRVRKAHANGASCTGTPTVDVLHWRSISGETIAETGPNGSTTDSNYHEYIFFGGRRIARADVASTSVFYYFADHLGSTRAMAQANGTVCFKMEYYPYGQEQPNSTTSCNTSYKFTGYEADSESGVDYALGRFYNARLARFMSGDPLGGDANDPQALNRYAYSLNNSINLIDPTGMLPTVDEDDRFRADFENGQWFKDVYTPAGMRSAHPMSTFVDAWEDSDYRLRVLDEDARDQLSGTPGFPISQECKVALNGRTAGFRGAQKNWSTIHAAAEANGIEPRVLAAIGVRETNFQNITGDKGHGHGVFQLDDRYNSPSVIARAGNLAFAGNVAAGRIGTSTSSYLKGGYGYGLAVTGALRDYNAGHRLTSPLLNTGYLGYIDLGTAHNSYVSDVIAIAVYCF